MKHNLRKGREHLPYAVPYGKQNITQTDIDAVVSVLNSDYLTQGPNVPIFEKAVANYTKANHAVAVHSATAALHVACLALEVGPGDMVWTVPTTFVATANCAIYCGAEIDFVDDVKSKNIDQNNKDNILELIAINLFKVEEKFEITLLFKNNAFITLLTEVLEVTLEDQNKLND